MDAVKAKLMQLATGEIEAYLRLKEIVKILRKECPWDKVQTHESLRVCMIEEAYEAAEAIDRKDMKNLKEELGDVMLQVIFHGILTEENGNFDMTDILNEEADKMIRRHPHVFCDESVKTVDKVLEKWENIKASEHSGNSLTSRLEDVPSALPALIRAYKVQKRAEIAGFGFQSKNDTFDKIVDETKELRRILNQHDLSFVENKIGKVLFDIVYLSRCLDIDAERALEKTIVEFIKHVSHMEDEKCR